MASVKVLTPDGKTSGKADLPADVFDVPVNVPLIHQVVIAQQAAARQGTASTKSRGEVRGGGAKPYRQKGTGRARQGSTRAPQFAGGGVVHGPQPRSYAQRTPKKMKAAALRGALSDRAREGRIHILSALVDGDVPSTSAVVTLLQSITEARHVLVVVDRDDVLAWKSLRNVSSVHAIAPDQLNTYDVLVSDEVIFTSSALDAFLASHPRVSAAEPGSVVTEATEAPATKAAAKTPASAAPYGKGSHAPLDDDGAPDGFDVKGNEDSKKYHQPGGRWYDQTVAEVWFATAEDAERAGFVEAGKSVSSSEDDK